MSTISERLREETFGGGPNSPCITKVRHLTEAADAIDELVEIATLMHRELSDQWGDEFTLESDGSKYAAILAKHKGERLGEKIIEGLEDAVIHASTTRDNELLSIVAAQALDEGLWFKAETAPEAYLQQALRKLHAVIEVESK